MLSGDCMNVLENLRVLKDDMGNNGWVIDAFPFIFKEIDYIVLVKLYDINDSSRPIYALLELEFLKKRIIFQIIWLCRLTQLSL